MKRNDNSRTANANGLNMVPGGANNPSGVGSVMDSDMSEQRNQVKKGKSQSGVLESLQSEEDSIVYQV